MGNITSTLTQPAGRTLFSFLRRGVDGLYWNASDEEFQVVDLLSANEVTRAPFRIPYTDNAGTYTWTLDAGDFLDGTYVYTSRELSGVTEFSPLAEVTLVITNGNVAGALLTTDVTADTGKELFSYIKRNRDGLYYDYVAGEIGAADMASAPEVVRASYRVPFVEDPPGEYSWELDISDFQDGTYGISTRELIGTLEILAGEDYTVGIYNGFVTTGVSLGEVGLNHDTGSRDNLRYVTAGGSPVEGAKICVYAAGGSLVPLGVTFTNKYGRWEAPVLVPVGAGYTIVFSKSGAYGPDTREIVI